MKNKTRNLFQRLRNRRGAASVEFALVAAFGGLFILLFGVIELGRAMFILGSANEATALGARVAIVCDMNDSRIKQRMTQIMPILKPENILISYYPANCSASGGNASTSCQSVTVSIAPGMKIDFVIPFVPLRLNLPEFTTTLTRESMNSAGCA